MAAQAPSAAQIMSPFPDPPEFAFQYTPENSVKGEIPKPPPIPKKFTVFGEEIDLEGKIVQPLPDAGLQQLYSSTANWKSELKKLNRSVVAAFLDLLEILIKSPDHAERLEKFETIRMLFINMHHLINEYRPIQARDTLRHIMVKQNKEVKVVNEKLRTHLSTAVQVFRRVHDSFSNSFFDSSLIKAPEAFTNPPEFDKLLFDTRKNLDLPSTSASKHETASRRMVLQQHLELLQLVDAEVEYSDSFSDLEFADDTSKSSEDETGNEVMEAEVYGSELNAIGEFDDRSTSESSPDNANENAVDANVEYMEDDDSDEEEEVSGGDDEFDSVHASPEPAQPDESPENEYQEPPAELVQDMAQNVESPVENFSLNAQVEIPIVQTPILSPQEPNSPEADL